MHFKTHNVKMPGMISNAEILLLELFAALRFEDELEESKSPGALAAEPALPIIEYADLGPRSEALDQSQTTEQR